MYRGNKKTKLFLGVLVISQILLLHPSSSFADRKQAIEKELLNKKASHTKLSKEARELNKELVELKQDLVKVSINVQKSEDSLIKTEQRLKELKEKKVTYIENIYRDQQAMGGLVSAARKYSSTPAVSMLAQDNPVNAARAFTVIKSVIPNIHEQSSYLKEQLKEIEKIEKDISEQLEIKVSQNKKYTRQENSLKSLLDERKTIYKKTEQQRLQYEKDMAKLLEESKSIEDLMKKLNQKTETIVAKGQLASNIMPVKGTVYTAFGAKDDIGAQSKGITFTTLPNAKIISPMAGMVKFAGPFQHYKQILIVEHPGGYHSLIAGMEKINTVVGAHLSPGEPIGTAKNVADSRIYYELRENGKPINPQKLLLAQKR